MLTDAHKQLIVSEDGIRPLLVLLNSPDSRVQRNAAGAVLNLTHTRKQERHLSTRFIYYLTIYTNVLQGNRV